MAHHQRGARRPGRSHPLRGGADRHQPDQIGRRAAGPPGSPRPAHRFAQPLAGAIAVDPCSGAGPATRSPGRGAVRRSGSVQDGQRKSGPFGGRRAVAGHRSPAARGARRGEYLGPARGRRVPGGGRGPAAAGRGRGGGSNHLRSVGRPRRLVQPPGNLHQCQHRPEPLSRRWPHRDRADPARRRRRVASQGAGSQHLSLLYRGADPGRPRAAGGRRVATPIAFIPRR